MDHEGFMLSEISQRQNDKYCMTVVVLESAKGKPIETEQNGYGGYEGLGIGEMSRYWSKGTNFQL